jgi:hypothetical protein
MILENVAITDLVDTIEYQLQRLAHAEDRIEETHHLPPPAMASFHEHIRRLRNSLDAHMAPAGTEQPSSPPRHAAPKEQGMRRPWRSRSWQQAMQRRLRSVGRWLLLILALQVFGWLAAASIVK